MRFCFWAKESVKRKEKKKGARAARGAQDPEKQDGATKSIEMLAY